MLGNIHPRAPRLLNAAGLGLISALLTAGAVFVEMLVLRPPEGGEDWAGAFAFLLAPPAQFVAGTWLAWYGLGESAPKPMRTWMISAWIGVGLVGVVMLPMALAGLDAAWRTLGLAGLGLALGSFVPAAVSRRRQLDVAPERQ